MESDWIAENDETYRAYEYNAIL